jgi:hypothetical protein
MIERAQAQQGRSVRFNQSGVAQSDQRQEQADAGGPRPDAGLGGIASAIVSRSGRRRHEQNSTPAQNTTPSAVCPGTCCCSHNRERKKRV